VTAVESIAGAWAAWIAPVALQVAILGALAAGIDLVIGRRGWHQVRAAAWLAVLLRIVVPPGVAAWSAGGIAVPAAGATGPGAEGPHAGPFLFGFWALGVAAVATAAVVRGVRSRHWCLASSQLLDDPAARAVLASVAQRLGLRQVPGLRVTAFRAIPAAVGFFRHAVVVPAELAAPGAREQLEHVLLHECAHVRRRDSLRALAVLSFRAVFWFHPAVWLASSRLASLREIACDEAVAFVLGARRGGYCRTLVSLAQPRAAPAPACGPALFSDRGLLVARIERLARPARPARAARAAAAAAILAGVLACGPALEPPAVPERAPEGVVTAHRGCLQLRFAVMRALAEAEGTDAR
jgi:hypothetical protein